MLGEDRRRYGQVGACFGRLVDESVGSLRDLIVGLNVALKGPFPLVGESKLSRESKMSRTDRENFQFVWNTHSKN
jgi:hypothetical protein